MSRPDRADARAASAGAASARIADARAAAPGSERTSSAIMSLIGERPVMLAPMSGVTEAPFRGICRRMGASLTYTEMVSAKGLHYNPDSRAARALLRFSAEEVPVALQLFGADPQIMAEQAARLSADRPGEIALIDINMGCPVAKVVAKGEGSALMRDPKTAVAVVEAVRAACPLPVTAKIRSGWSASEKNAVEFSLALEQAGVAAVAVHGRTRDQFYRGRADKEVIARVKSAVGIPVFGSGDVLCAQDVVEMFDQTGADGVMVARGAYGNPWIFREARHLLDTGETLAPPSAAERLAVAREHAAALVDAFGERAVARMR
ncbi:MAG: tRNA dihydrouridine synthase DusB, partial [Coriobacteriia bacterium]|nr:tRNA dihydrouridine synthase DusB [Coriobacteriia bacterium]